MNIIDHLSVGVPDINNARAFYDPVMETLGCSCMVATENFAAYGDGAVQFLLMLPDDGEPYTAGNGTHVCFVASNRGTVDRFHKTSLDKQGTDNGAPGVRPDYPKPGIYTAFVIDPFGNKLEAIHNGFAS